MCGNLISMERFKMEVFGISRNFEFAKVYFIESTTFFWQNNVELALVLLTSLKKMYMVPLS